MKVITAALLVSAVLLPPHAAAQGAPPRVLKLLVFDFVAQGEAPRALGRTLSEEAARAAAAIEGLTVLTQADVAARLGADVQRPTGSCADDRACMAEIAGALDADRTLAGSVTQIGDSFVLSVSVVDARRMSTLGGAQETMKGARLDQLLDGARRLTHKAITGKLLETTGSIDFEVTDEGAQVLLDGEEIGKGPLRETRRVPEGPHRILVQREGFAQWESTVRATAGGSTLVAPRLVRLAGSGAPAFHRLYVDLTGLLTATLEVPVQGLRPCSGTPFGDTCGRGAIGAAVGWRARDWLAFEGSVRYRSYQVVDGTAGITLDHRLLGAAAVWNPAGNRYFSLAGEAGYSIGGAHPFTDGAGSSTGVSADANGPFARAEGRAALQWEWVQLGLRAGFTGMWLTGSASFPTIGARLEPGLVATFDLGLALRFYLY